MDKSHTLQKAAVRLEHLMERGDLSRHTRQQVQQAHQEVKEVRSRLQHEALITRISERFLAPRNSVWYPDRVDS